MKAIANRFGLILEESWNKELMPYLGRHPDQHHKFMLRNFFNGYFHTNRGDTISINNSSFGFISLILRGFSLFSRSFYLEKGSLSLPFCKNFTNLREPHSDNKQNKPKTQVKKIFLLKESLYTPKKKKRK